MVVRRLRACATATLCTTAGASAAGVGTGARLCRLPRPPRTFHPRRQLLEQWDEFAAGACISSTCTPLTRSTTVASVVQADTARGAAGEERYTRRVLNERYNVSEIIAASLLPIAASEVSAHARVVTTPRRLNVSDERCIHGLTCVGDVSIQLQSLSRVHRLAGRHLRGELRLTEAQLDDLIVIRSQPDVTWNTDVADGASAAKTERRAVRLFRTWNGAHTKTRGRRLRGTAASSRTAGRG